MMLKLGFNTTKSLWSKFNENREEKMRKAYDELEAAARDAADAAQDTDLFPRSRKEAGRVTQAAHNRLERALEEFSSFRDDAADRFSDEWEDARKDGSKLWKKGRKEGRKAAKRGSKRADKLRAAALKKLGKEEKSSKLWPILGTLTLLSAIGAGIYYFFLRDVIEKEQPSTKPPRVEEFSSDADNVEGSHLVYTSTSEGSGFTETTPEEGLKERDEELLDSLDEQLAKHRLDKDKN
ncbi:hypothetical protein [Corynebacterium phocae]|nr:hypothetical protein [Corynebacterium phocae]